MVYPSEPKTTLSCICEKLGFDTCPDIGHGEFIYYASGARMAVYAADPRNARGHLSGTCAISFFCDAIQSTVARLKGRGVALGDQLADAGFGRGIRFEMPDRMYMQLYFSHYDNVWAERS